MIDKPPLQFGVPEAGRAYRPRPAAFGLAADDQGRIALVHVTRPHNDYFDLPGGALETGESAEAALVREFGEETGLVVRCEERLCSSGQFLMTAVGEPTNNLADYFEVTVERADPGLKIEVDHTLVWMPEAQALGRLRHDAHAWALASWIRRRARSSQRGSP